MDILKLQTKKKFLRQLYCPRIISFIPFIFFTLVYSQNNTIWIKDGYGNSGTSGNSVSIMLANEDTLAGVQLNLEYDHSIIQFEEVTLADHVSAMELYTSEPEPGILSLILVSLNGESIYPQLNRILDIHYFVSEIIQNEPVPLEIKNIVLSDVDGNTVGSQSDNGFFFTGNSNHLRVENGFNAVPISIYNELPIGGLQFTLSCISCGSLGNSLYIDPILTTSRSDEMELNFNEVMPGVFNILLYSLEQKSISPGAGPILNLIFNNTTDLDSPFPFQPIELSNVVVSDQNGATMESSSYDGNFLLINPSLIAQPPVITELNEAYVEEDDSLFINLSASDINIMDSLIFSSVSDMSEINLQIIDNDILRVVPAEDWFGISIITVIVSDGTFEDSTSFTLNVNPVNDAPILSAIADTSILEDTPLSLILEAIDVDNDQEDLVFSVTSDLPDVATINMVDNQLMIIPAEDWFGVLSISVTVSDSLLSDEVTFNLIVDPSDDLVYSGDTNRDGIVNALDILPIGIYFLLTGPSRNSNSFDWSENSIATIWNPARAAYADTDGNGIVNERDIFGIGLNWERTHAEGISNYVIDINDSTTLSQHLNSFKQLFNSLSGDSEPVIKMKSLLSKIIGSEKIPNEFKLYKNYPNPFNPSTTIKFDLEKNSNVTLNILDINGRLVEKIIKNKSYTSGSHKFKLNAKNLSNGIYFYQIIAGNWQSSHKMIILK